MRFMITRRIKSRIAKTYVYRETILSSMGYFFEYVPDPMLFNTMGEAQFVANGFELEPNVEYVVSPWEGEG